MQQKSFAAIEKAQSKEVVVDERRPRTNNDVEDTEAAVSPGDCHLRTQRRDQAVASFEESIRVAPDFDQSYLNLARVYAIEEHPDKSREVLQELLKRHPDHAGAKSALAQLPQ